MAKRAASVRRWRLASIELAKRHLADGKSLRWIAKVCNFSRSTVRKLKAGVKIQGYDPASKVQQEEVPSQPGPAELLTRTEPMPPTTGSSDAPAAKEVTPSRSPIGLVVEFACLRQLADLYQVEFPGLEALLKEQAEALLRRCVDGPRGGGPAPLELAVARQLGLERAAKIRARRRQNRRKCQIYTAYNCFVKERYPVHARPGRKMVEVIKLVRAQWLALEPQERRKYEAMSQERLASLRREAAGDASAPGQEESLQPGGSQGAGAAPAGAGA